MEVQASTTSMLPRKILVALDGSTGSARALDWAIELARALDAEIVAAYVVQLLSPTAVGLGVAPVELPKDWIDDLRRRFENDWTAPLKRAGVRYRTVFETDAGAPAPMLIGIAADLHPDLIVTGRRGLGGFGELLLGSVSHQLVLHAPVPVVVIPAQHRHPAAASQTELASVAAP
jgi:nucleotide-binding universal stress UspA family protein